MNENPSSSARIGIVLREVKYSLPEMLEELKAERSVGSFASEKLDQTEIGKLFKLKTTRRAKSSK
jgi:hypothetical protein